MVHCVIYLESSMLDVGYPSMSAFRAACAEFGYDADALLASGEYVLLEMSGWVVAASML